MRRYRSGFTFIELLCVVAIIAILAAILFPVFAQARSKARQTSCASNLQQLAIAINLYAQDHNGRFPPKDDDFGPIFHYVKNYAVFRCPSDATPGPEKKALAEPSLELAAVGMPSTASMQPFSTSYNYRGGLRNDDWGDIPLMGDRLLQFADAKPPSWVPPALAGESAFLGLHSDGVNRVTISGSVKWFRGKDLTPVNEAQKKQLIMLREARKRSGASSTSVEDN